MPSEFHIAEFLSLVKDTREQVAYFKELGVEGTEKISREVSAKMMAPERPAAATVHQQVAFSPTKEASAATVRAAPAKQAATSLSSDTLFGNLSAPPVRIQKSLETFEEIWADIGDCTRCPLYQGRTNIVHTDGNRKARLMFVGEAPGADEDAQARPFVGRAGQLLTKIIEAIGLKREEVLIGNVNRCRPPANRPPTPEEASMCKPFLLREIAAVQPEVIVVLGNTAMRNLLDLKQGITKVRGQFQDYQGVKVMPTFHPAYLLRDPSKKKETWEDLKKVRDYLDSTRKQES
ncbi:MAG: uracil-DNA glycosylase [bacterium]